jgi:hypothetical protein
VFACAVLAGVAETAGGAEEAATPCWVRLLNDWYDGRIDNIYPIPCYKAAIAHLPTDVQVYSSARSMSSRALAVALAHKKHPNAPVPTVTESSGRGTSTGPIPSAIDSSSPGGATSFPLPLLILGGLALVLLAAGAIGLVVRRMQGRGGPPGPPPPASP